MCATLRSNTCEHLCMCSTMCSNTLRLLFMSAIIRSKTFVFHHLPKPFYQPLCGFLSGTRSSWPRGVLWGPGTKGIVRGGVSIATIDNVIPTPTQLLLFLLLPLLLLLFLLLSSLL